MNISKTASYENKRNWTAKSVSNIKYTMIEYNLNMNHT